MPALLFLLFVAWLVWPQPTYQNMQTTKTGRKTALNPAMFTGVVREAYSVAQQNPVLLENLKCYCGCDNPSHVPYHRNLYECFTDTHGANCQVCVSEALEANSLYQQGMSPGEVRRMIDQRFGR